eukprot:scaffold181343_cov30-Tisochrysis_lutea.AAC.2
MPLPSTRPVGSIRTGGCRRARCQEQVRGGSIRRRRRCASPSPLVKELSWWPRHRRRARTRSTGSRAASPPARAMCGVRTGRTKPSRNGIVRPSARNAARSSSRPTSGGSTDG